MGCARLRTVNKTSPPCYRPEPLNMGQEGAGMRRAASFFKKKKPRDGHISRLLHRSMEERPVEKVPIERQPI